LLVYIIACVGLRAEEIDQMAKRQHSRCYFCRQAGMGEATYANICPRHQLLISLRLLALLFVRKTRLSNLWKIVRWW
jgi:hypothetical protein